MNQTNWLTRKVFVAFFLLCMLLIGGRGAWAAEKQLRIGTLAPKNSLYHRQLMELGEVWRTAQGGTAKYLIYPDGSQGGETELARRMRIGQLQGALLSVVGLREIEPSISALQNMPLLFKSWDEVDYVREKMRTASDKASVQLRAKARQEVDEAVDAIKKRGLIVNRPNAAQMQEWNDLAEKLYPRIRGVMVPAETFDEVFVHLKAYRAGKAK